MSTFTSRVTIVKMAFTLSTWVAIAVTTTLAAASSATPSSGFSPLTSTVSAGSGVGVSISIRSGTARSSSSFKRSSDILNLLLNGNEQHASSYRRSRSNAKTNARCRKHHGNSPLELMQNALVTSLDESTPPVEVYMTVPRGGANAAVAKAPTSNSMSLETRLRLGRSIVVASCCLATHLLSATFPKLSPITASSIIALSLCSVGSLWKDIAISPPTAAAAFSGTFAGMSAHVAMSVANAKGGHFYWYCYASALTLYSIVAGASYAAFDVYKIGVGKGGRLGSMAFLANVAFATVFLPSAVVSSWKQMITTVFNVPSTIAAALPAAPAWATLLVSSAALVASKRQATANSTTSKEKTSILSTILVQGSKLAVLSILLSRLIDMVSGGILGRDVIVSWLTTLASVLMGCTVVQKSPGLVCPASIVGLVGSTILQPLLPSTVQIAAPLYMGAFLGMTGIKFNMMHFVEAATIAATLLQLQLWNGFGGRLGLFAYIGVYFAMP